MKTYAIGDVHGELELLEGLLREIDRDAIQFGGPAYRLVFLGDYVDRGPDSAGVVERVMQLHQDPPTGIDVVALFGNHEELMMVGMTQRVKMGNMGGVWLANGGDSTLAQYNQLDEEIKGRHLLWMSKLPVKFETEKQFFCHAGVDPSSPLDRQDERVLTWARRWWDEPGCKDLPKHIVYGHTPQRRGEWRLHPWATCCDLGAVHYGVLGAARFSDAQPGPEAFIEYGTRRRR